MGNISQYPKRNFVVNDIRHFHAAFYLLKMMLVMPHAIGAVALFIGKIFFVFYMGYFGHPIEWNAEDGTDIIFNNLAGINLVALLMTDNSKRKMLRSYLFKIGSAAEKIPNSINIGRNFLNRFDGVYGHEFLF